MRRVTANIDFVKIGQHLLNEVRASGNLYYVLDQRKFIVDLGDKQSKALKQMWSDGFRTVGLKEDRYEFAKGTGLPIKQKTIL